MLRLAADASIIELEIKAQTPALRSGFETRDFTLSKLNSYPSYALLKEHVSTVAADEIVVELNGFEPMTLALQRRCSPS
jgi:hypothetical protein